MKLRLRGPSGKSLLAIAALLAAAAVLAACGGTSGATTTPSASPSQAVASVSILNFTFTPKTLTVAAGTTVTWTNHDPVVHNVTSADSLALNAAATSLFASGSLGQGQTFSYTFTTKGTYFYVCTIHRTMPSMHAEVVVK
jgi:plastocyanin